MTDPASAAERLDLALLQISTQANSTETMIRTLRLLAERVDPRSRRALHLACRELAGDAVTVTGRPPVNDGESLRRIGEALARGVPRHVAIHVEASRLSVGDGGSVETHARRLRGKSKIDGGKVSFPPSDPGTLAR